MAKSKKRDAADLLRDAIGDTPQQEIATRLECSPSTLSRILSRQVRPLYPLRARVEKEWPGIPVPSWDLVRTIPRRDS